MDILDKMTKAELIRYIRSTLTYSMRPPRKSTILFWRWEEANKKLEKRRRMNIEHGERLDMKTRNEYAKKFNMTKDVSERLRILKKMKPYEKAFTTWMNEHNALMKEDGKLDKMYKRMELEREKESSE